MKLNVNRRMRNLETLTPAEDRLLDIMAIEDDWAKIAQAMSLARLTVEMRWKMIRTKMGNAKAVAEVMRRRKVYQGAGTEGATNE